MSEKINNGGAAFPLPMGSETTQGTDGMTLRDYFAGKALAGLLAAGDHDNFTANAIAKDSYVVADAMIEARGKS